MNCVFSIVKNPFFSKNSQRSDQTLFAQAVRTSLAEIRRERGGEVKWDHRFKHLAKVQR